MPLVSVDIEKQFNVIWTNRYIVEAPDLAQAVVQSNLITSAEAAIHTAQVTILRHRVSTFIEGDDTYQIVVDNIQGARASNLEYLPLWNVVRCDFTAVGGGRPSRKYLRLPITEPDQVGGVLTPTFRALINQSYVAVLLDEDVGYRDVDGQAFSGGATFPQVAMRQLRRGSRRRTSPVLG